MNNTQKIVIVALIGVLIVLSGITLSTLLKEPSKTVELFENGTTIEVPANTNLSSHDNFSTTYVTGKNTTIIGIDNNNLVGALASKMLSSMIVDRGEKQDNGIYKLDKKSIMELDDQLGREYDEKNIKEVYIDLRHNNTVNQTVIIIGADEKEINDISNTIHWKQGKQSNITNITETNAPTSSVERTDDICDWCGAHGAKERAGIGLKLCDACYKKYETEASKDPYDYEMDDDEDIDDYDDSTDYEDNMDQDISTDDSSVDTSSDSGSSSKSKSKSSGDIETTTG